MKKFFKKGIITIPLTIALVVLGGISTYFAGQVVTANRFGETNGNVKTNLTEIGNLKDQYKYINAKLDALIDKQGISQSSVNKFLIE